MALTEHNTLLLPTEQTMNGNLEVTDKGGFVSVSKNNLIFDQGQRVIKIRMVTNGKLYFDRGL